MCLATAGGASALTGCRVTETDVQRWETTELGPIKLGAVLLHDKYSIPLRVEAATALIRMKPRSGKRVGLEKMLDTLKDVTPDDRSKILAELIPKVIVAEMDKPVVPQQGVAPDEQKQLDPSIPFKDAAFGLLTYDKDKVNLVRDDDQVKMLRQALARWGTTDFDHRISISSQLYGLEQVFRYLGTEGVSKLPPLINPDSQFDRIASLVGELGDQPTKEAASKKLVEVATYIEGPVWFAKIKPQVQTSNTAAGYNASDAQLTKQVADYQDEQAIKTYASMKKVGGRPMVDYLLGVAGDKTKPLKRRQGALAALEGKLDRTNANDAAKILAIASEPEVPDEVRELAFSRMAELPREVVAAKLYELFGTPANPPKKWKVRWVAASTLLRMSNASQVPDFLAHLPSGAATGFAMSEPLEYGAIIGRMNPPVTRDSMVAELKSPVLATKLTALGYFYNVGKASDLAVVQPLETDTTPVPKVEGDDAKWQCAIPKQGGKPGETEMKELTHVGDFVKFCVEPAMSNRK